MNPKDNIEKRIEELKSWEFDKLIGSFWRFRMVPTFDNKYPEYYHGGILDLPIPNHKDIFFHLHEWFEKNTHELASYIYFFKINDDTLFEYHWHPFQSIDDDSSGKWVRTPHLHFKAKRKYKFAPKLHFPTPYYNGESDNSIDLILQPRNLIRVVTRFIQEEVLLRLDD